MYGSLYVAPSLYGWVKITSKIWPVTNIRTAMMKTVLEQLSYGPLATASFFFIISLMEHKTVEESKQEVVDKFWPTYKVHHSLEHYSKKRKLTKINLISLHFLILDRCILLDDSTNIELFGNSRKKSCANCELIRFIMDNIFSVYETKVNRT